MAMGQNPSTPVNTQKTSLKVPRGFDSSNNTPQKLLTWPSRSLEKKELLPKKPLSKAKAWLSLAGLLKVKPLVVWKRNPSKPKGLRV